MSGPFGVFDELSSHLGRETDLPFLHADDNERRRRYALLKSYVGLTERRTRMGAPIGQAVNSAEFGEPKTIVGTILDYTVGDAVELNPQAKEKEREVFETSGFLDSLLLGEAEAIELGDAVFHFYKGDDDKWIAEVWPSGDFFVQYRERDGSPKRVALVEENTKPGTAINEREFYILEYYSQLTTGGQRKVWYREGLWRIDPDKTERPESKFKAEGIKFDRLRMTKNLAELRKATPIKPEEIKLESEAHPKAEIGDSWFDFESQIMPVRHLINDSAGPKARWGKSNLQNAIKVFPEINKHNTNVSKSAEIATLCIAFAEYSDKSIIPPIFKMDRKPGSKATDDNGVPTIPLRPGALMLGKLSFLDNSKQFSAAMDHDKILNNKLATATKVPELAWNPKEVKIVSGIAFRIAMSPLLNFIGRRRVNRLNFYDRLFRDLLGLSEIKTTLKPEIGFISFGTNIPSPETLPASISTLLVSNVISTKEARNALKLSGQIDSDAFDDADFQKEKDDKAQKADLIQRGLSRADQPTDDPADDPTDDPDNPNGGQSQ